MVDQPALDDDDADHVLHPSELDVDATDQLDRLDALNELADQPSA
ncbi:MAG: hypothetical protein U0414_04215 [Polyangiaceae bacterium]